MSLEDWALVVGINGYPAMGSLRGAEADAKDFHAWVTAADGGAVSHDRAALITSEPPRSRRVRDAMPTRERIEAAFADMNDAANDNNAAGNGLVAGRRLYLFFSGHGFSPSFDLSALLTANATATAIHNVGCRLWADWLFRGGWFKEVLLFQDTCRMRLKSGTLMPPFLEERNAPGTARFYALAAVDNKVALEQDDGNGGRRGVFSMTLMDGLRGAARDPATGALTSDSLRGYLQTNMCRKYDEATRARADVSQMPEVFNPTPFVILPATNAVELFPVHVTLPPGAAGARLEDHTFATLKQTHGDAHWHFKLPTGLYRIVVENGPSKLFQVTGALGTNGSKQVVDVEF